MDISNLILLLLLLACPLAMFFMHRGGGHGGHAGHASDREAPTNRAQSPAGPGEQTKRRPDPHNDDRRGTPG